MSFMPVVYLTSLFTKTFLRISSFFLLTASNQRIYQKYKLIILIFLAICFLSERLPLRNNSLGLDVPLSDLLYQSPADFVIVAGFVPFRHLSVIRLLSVFSESIYSADNPRFSFTSSPQSLQIRCALSLSTLVRLGAHHNSHNSLRSPPFLLAWPI